MMDGRFNHPRFTVRRRRHSTFYEVKRLVYREGTKINTCNLWPTCTYHHYIWDPQRCPSAPLPRPRPLNKMWLGTVITKKHERRRGNNASIWSVCLMLFTELKSLKQPDKITWSSEKTHQNADAVSTKEYLYGAKCEVLMSVCNTCTSRIRSRSFYSVYYYIDDTNTDPLSMGVVPKKALNIKCFLDLQP